MAEIEEGNERETLKTVKAISQGWKALSLLADKLQKLWNSSSHKTTSFSRTRWGWASPVKFLATALRRRELRASLGPFHLISTASAFSGSRSQPRRLLTTSLTSYFLEIRGGHGLHFIILTTIGSCWWGCCCCVLENVKETWLVVGDGEKEKSGEEEEREKESWKDKTETNLWIFERIRVLCSYTNAVLSQNKNTQITLHTSCGVKLITLWLSSTPSTSIARTLFLSKL